MKVYKPFTSWPDPAYGGEQAHHCDFTLEAGEALELPILKQKIGPVPEGKEWQVHFHCTYHEKSVEED